MAVQCGNTAAVLGTLESDYLESLFYYFLFILVLIYFLVILVYFSSLRVYCGFSFCGVVLILYYI